jgi:hypothetical protein
LAATSKAAAASAAAAEAAGRAGQALELRKAGVGYALIVKQLRYPDEATARAAVAAVLDEALADEGREAALLERLRLDGMLTGLYPKARAGDSRAIEQTLRLMERKRVLDETGGG